MRSAPVALALVLAALAFVPACANPYTYCQQGSATDPASIGPMKPHLEGEPLFFMKSHQLIPKQPQFNEHKVWTQVSFCSREACKRYVKASFPEMHTETMVAYRTCVED